MMPEPYIIWNTVGSNNLFKHDLLHEEHKVVLVIGEIVTNTSKSNPTGKDNDVLVKTNKNWTQVTQNFSMSSNSKFARRTRRKRGGKRILKDLNSGKN
jgi:hypothetical protein